jgi:hypothetical protein
MLSFLQNINRQIFLPFIFLSSLIYRDSIMAETVVDFLFGLACKQKTIVCVIHQPSSQIMEKFET